MDGSTVQMIHTHDVMESLVCLVTKILIFQMELVALNTSYKL